MKLTVFSALSDLETWQRAPAQATPGSFAEKKERPEQAEFQ
jgi:hypothetical protein